MQLKENLKDAYFCTPKSKDQRKSVKFQYKGHMIHYKKNYHFGWYQVHDFHKNNDTNYCAIETHRSLTFDLFRRHIHIVAKSITRRTLKRYKQAITRRSLRGYTKLLLLSHNLG